MRLFKLTLFLLTFLCVCGCGGDESVDTGSTATDEYSGSEYLYLDQDYESWSSILLSKGGDSFFVQKDGDVAENLIYTDPATQKSVYVEFDDEQYPSLMVVDDVTFVFTNYRDNLVDIALINGEKEIATSYDVECDLSKFAPATKASVHSNADDIANIAYSVGSVAEAATVADLAEDGVSSLTVAAFAQASKTAYLAIIDSDDIWIASAADDLVAAANTIDLESVSSQSDAILSALEQLSDIIDDISETIDEAIEKLENRTENGDAAEYVVDITVSDIISSGETSATCELQGTLEAKANDEEFDFDYGVCYSTNPTPTVDDQTVSLSCVSSDDSSSVSLTLPQSMTMSELETETTYYYRAYFKDNITEEVLYGDDIKEFSLAPVVDERAILEQIYLATGGENWTNNTNWCTDAPLSEWYGVKVHYMTGEVTELDLSENNLVGELNVSGLSRLNDLSCNENQLTTLDVSSCSELGFLACYDNQLTTLDISGCSWLASLHCAENQLVNLDLSGCSLLGNLSCSDNQLANLNLSGCSGLYDLSCSYNQLTTLDLSGCSDLNVLVCSYNQLTTLDFSGCSDLNYLLCEDNQLTTLDLSGCSSLSDLSCYGNQLKSIYLSSDPSYLDYESWGEWYEDIYKEPSHKRGYQYPKFYYK